MLCSTETIPFIPKNYNGLKPVFLMELMMPYHHTPFVVWAASVKIKNIIASQWFLW